MRILIASLAALVAFAIAAPAGAQTEGPNAPPPVAKPKAKPKPGTVAYCNALKSTSAKTACLKRVHTRVAAHAKTPAKPAPVRVVKKPATSAHVTKPAPAPSQAQAPAAAAAAPTPPQTIAVPPLPQKTI